MPFLPQIPESRTSQQVTDMFFGYNHNLKIAEGEFYDEQNMTADYYPMLASRRSRGIVESYSNPQGMLAKEALAVAAGGKLYYNGRAVTGITLTQGEKQLVSMGAYLVIWPDRKYVNTKDLTDFGSIDASVTTSGGVSYSLCDQNAGSLGVIATEEPQEPEAGQYWLDTTSDPHSLKRFDAASGMWYTVPTVYVKIESAGIGAAFKQYDGVTLSGIAYSGESESVKRQYEQLNGTHILQAVGDNYIVIVGLIDVFSTQTSGAVTAERKAPDMDFVTEAENRIWGCKYGMVGGKAVNEIYCCALGDFKNWQKYQGISTDSYAASVGTDGAWTGAVTHLGYPLFFKENVLHKVYISASGAHQISDLACRGVQSGCHKSLAIVGETLFYKSRAGVMCYDGSLPESVNDALGEEKYGNASAGAIDRKYYISMDDSDGRAHMFCYDAAKRIWHREDDTDAICFARSGNELYYIDAGTEELVAINGSVGEVSEDVSWRADTGLIGYATVEQKYISRFNIRMKLPNGSSADVYIQYDSDGLWEHCGHMDGVGTKSFMLPVRPRRCDHFRIRIEGRGEIRVYSFSKIFEQGSDVV